MNNIKKIKEDGDAPANNAGSGNIASLGVTQVGKPSNWGEPGVSPKNQRKHKSRIFRRKSPSVVQEQTDNRRGKFAGNDTFIIPSGLFHKARLQKQKGKHWKSYIGEDEHGQAIREYARKNYGKAIVLQDESTGAMCYASYGKKK